MEAGGLTAESQRLKQEKARLANGKKTTAVQLKAAKRRVKRIRQCLSRLSPADLQEMVQLSVNPPAPKAKAKAKAAASRTEDE